MPAASLERTEWATAAPPDGEQLELLVFAGHSSCLDDEDVEVTDDDLDRRGWNRPSDVDCREPVDP